MGGELSRRSVLVVEDDPMLCELIALALESHGFAVVTASTAAGARRVFRQVDPDGLVLDIDLGPGPNGFDLADVMRRQSPHVAIVFLTHLPDARFAGRGERSLPEGIAYLRKSALSDVDSLVDAVDCTIRGTPRPEHRHDRDPNRPLASLTRKQLEVLQLMADGQTNAQIAAHRGVTVKAVEETIGRTFAALDLDPALEGNMRVAAVRRFLGLTGAVPPQRSQTVRA